MSMSVAQVKIGEKLVPAIGFGAMQFSFSIYGQALDYEDRFKVSRHGCIQMLTNQSSLKLLDRAYELGCTHWDSADIYGDSEEDIGKW